MSLSTIKEVKRVIKYYKNFKFTLIYDRAFKEFILERRLTPYKLFL